MEDYKTPAAILRIKASFSVVAKWLRHQTDTLGIEGSNPSDGTLDSSVLIFKKNKGVKDVITKVFRRGNGESVNYD